MTRCVAFLRAVNVGGRTVKMEALRAAFEALGFEPVQTFIASGNVIFETRARGLAALERPPADSICAATDCSSEVVRATSTTSAPAAAK